MSGLRIARNVTLDKRTGDVWIDDQRLGIYVTPDWQIEDMSGAFVIHLPIVADSVHVHRSLAEDLDYIRDVVDKHRAELGLAPCDRGAA